MGALVGMALRAGALIGAVGLLGNVASPPVRATAPAEVQDCPVAYLGPYDVEHFNDYEFTNDGEGRPESAVADYGTLVRQDGGRDQRCEARVGQYAGVAAGYDGGHLIASFLNGPSIRENLVPMQGLTVNRDVYLTFERAIGRCLDKLGPGALKYTVSVLYHSSGLVPGEIHPHLTIAVQGVHHEIELYIPNQVLDDNTRAELDEEVDQQADRAGCPR